MEKYGQVVYTVVFLRLTKKTEKQFEKYQYLHLILRVIYQQLTIKFSLQPKRLFMVTMQIRGNNFGGKTVVQVAHQVGFYPITMFFILQAAETVIYTPQMRLRVKVFGISDHPIKNLMGKVVLIEQLHLIHKIIEFTRRHIMVLFVTIVR